MQGAVGAEVQVSELKWHWIASQHPGGRTGSGSRMFSLLPYSLFTSEGQLHPHTVTELWLQAASSSHFLAWAQEREGPHLLVQI